MKKVFNGFDDGAYVPANESTKKYIDECLDKDIPLYVDESNRVWSDAGEYLGDVEKIDLI